jgi:hypothetical protein
MANSALALALVIAAQAGAAPKPAWKLFTSEEGGFSVLMPGEPVEQRKSVPSPDGPVELINHSARLGQGVCLVNMTPLAEAALKRGRDALLKDARAAVARIMPGKVVKERVIELDGHPGVELVIDAPAAEKMPSGATIKVRCYLVEKRLLQVMALIPKGQGSSKEVAKFFDSFGLIGPGEGPPGGAPKAKRKR